MEILFELLLWLGQLLCELVLQLIFEALAELGVEAVKEAVRSGRPARDHEGHHPWLAAIGYVLLGAIFALISLIPLRHGFATPVAAHRQPHRHSMRSRLGDGAVRSLAPATKPTPDYAASVSVRLSLRVGLRGSPAGLHPLKVRWRLLPRGM